MELPSFCSTFLRNILRHVERATTAVAKNQGGKKLFSGFMAANILLLCLAPCSSAAQNYPLNKLKQDIAAFLMNEYSQTAHENIDISVGNLDSRLRLAVCGEAPSYSLQDQTGLGGNISVKAECKSGNKWSVHVPTQVTIYRSIPIAKKDIGRGDIISREQIGTTLVNVSNIRQAFVSDSAAVIGQEAKRNIGQGEPFKTSSLDSPTAIKRGEMVTLESLAGSITVNSAGTALADGRVGQKIRVRNNTSERVVSGVVIRQGLVQTL
jgi:flagellar basal body P-ring formation protein FlgA